MLTSLKRLVATSLARPANIPIAVVGGNPATLPEAEVFESAAMVIQGARAHTAKRSPHNQPTLLVLTAEYDF